MFNLHKLLALSGMYPALILAAPSASTAMAAPITLQNATADFSQSGWPVTNTIDGDTSGGSGWAVFPELGSSHTVVWETAADLGGAIGTNLTFTLPMITGSNHTFGDFRLAVTTDSRSTFADGLTSGGDVTATWTTLMPLTVTDTGGATFTINGDNSITVSGANPATNTYTVTAKTLLAGITGFRLEALVNADLTSEPSGGPGRSLGGNFILNEFEVSATAVVPEPSTIILLVFGACGLYAIRKR